MREHIVFCIDKCLYKTYGRGSKDAWNLTALNGTKGNCEKCLKHGLSLAEIENVFGRAVVILPDKQNPTGEEDFGR